MIWMLSLIVCGFPGCCSRTTLHRQARIWCHCRPPEEGKDSRVSAEVVRRCSTSSSSAAMELRVKT